jgi:hypothetical protein
MLIRALLRFTSGLCYLMPDLFICRHIDVTILISE